MATKEELQAQADAEIEAAFGGRELIVRINEVIPAKYDYEEITIGFNSKYLLDIASVIESKNIQLKFKNSTSPVLIHDNSD